MSTNVTSILDELVRGSHAADAGDLQGLATLHGRLEQLASASQGVACGLKLQEKTMEAKKLLEQLILREVEDVGGAIGALQAAMAEMRKVVEGAVTPADEARGEVMISEEDAPLVAEFIVEARGHIESAESELLKLESQPGDADAINAVFRGFHTIKGVAGFLNLQEIGSLAHAAENLLDLGRKGELEMVGGVLDLILESSDVMKRMIVGLEQAAKTRTPMPREVGLEGLIKRLHGAAKGERVTTARTDARAEVAPAMKTATSEPSKEAGDATVKVSTGRLDKLINAVGELVIAHAMAGQDVARIGASDQRFLRNMTQLGKLTRELQDLSMSMRMVPIQGVFQKMTRLVRDLGRKAGKTIELQLQGGETELDRNVVEAIGDPLVHMVRNAADHGIENADDRRKAGKREAGRIVLNARQQAGHIVVEITDDGRGLNKTKILKKARDAGIVREGQELSEQDIFRLIFHAGLSTAEKITDVSGRGVGMDVVRKNVEALRGRIEIASEEGKGSTFTIRLPLTLAVIDGLIVKVGDERFIVPLTSIEQSLRPRGEQLSTVQGRDEMCMVRDRLLPVLRLHQLFAIEPRNKEPEKALFVIVHDNQRRCCLMVDEVIGQQQVVIKGLGKTLGQVPACSGGAILGDGCVSLILDVPGIMELVKHDSTANSEQGSL